MAAVIGNGKGHGITAQGFIEVAAQDPKDHTGVVTALIPRETVHHYWKTHPVTVQNLELAKCVLEHPERIYYGIRRFNAGGWCYVGRPDSYFVKFGCQVPLPPGFLFAVYLEPGYHVYQWRLEEPDEDEPLAPKNAATRYERLSWQRTS